MCVLSKIGYEQIFLKNLLAAAADDRVPGKPGPILGHDFAGLRGNRNVGGDALQRVGLGLLDPALGGVGA